MAVNKKVNIELTTTGTEKSKRQITGVESSIKSMVKTGLSFYAVKKAFDIGLEATKASAEVNKMRSSFESLAKKAGLSADILENRLNTAFKNTITQSELLQLSNNALLLGLPLTTETFAELAEAGRRLGEAVGQDARYGFESLVTGIGRQSRMMLDNLGIIVDTDKAYRDYSITIGKTKDELTDAEKKLAFFEATMASVRDKMQGLGSDTDTASTKLQQLKTDLDDLKIFFGNVLPSFLSGDQRWLLKSLGLDNTAEIDEGIRFVSLYNQELAKISSTIQSNFLGSEQNIASLEIVKERLNGIFGELINGNITIEQANAKMTTYVSSLNNTLDAQNKQRKTLQDNSEASVVYTRDIDQMILADEEYLDITNEIGGSSEELGKKLERLHSIHQGESDVLADSIVNWKGYDQTIKETTLSAQSAANAIRSLGAILDNKNAKLSDYLMGIGGVLGMIPGFQGFGGALSIGGAIGSVLGFAEGGDPPTGRPSIVGERGPELFVPKVAGTIIPNNQIGGVTINISGDFLGTEQQADKLAYIIAERSKGNFNNIAVKA